MTQNPPAFGQNGPVEPANDAEAPSVRPPACVRVVGRWAGDTLTDVKTHYVDPYTLETREFNRAVSSAVHEHAVGVALVEVREVATADRVGQTFRCHVHLTEAFIQHLETLASNNTPEAS